MENALIIFAKTPIPNYSKTRLINPFSAEQAAQFYSASLYDVFLTMQNNPYFDLLFAIAPEKFDPKNFPFQLEDSQYFFQTGQDLGQRMYQSFKMVFEKAYKKVAIIGSDFPQISTATIQATFEKLDISDCVLGPTKDGGYYLIGLNKPIESLFQNIDWSTEKVYRQTQQIAKQQSIKISEMAIENDVDDIDDLKQLYHKLEQMDKSLTFFPANVWRFLQIHKKIFV